MSDKSRITYSLKPAGSEELVGIHILTTECTKVPEVGEVIGIDTKIDREKLIIQYKDIKGESLQKWLRQDNAQIQGDFVVVGIKRWFEIFHKRVVPTNLPVGLESNSRTRHYEAFPEEYTVETFEVFIEPFRHTELTETPIAKLRNQLTPILGAIDMLELITEFPEKEEELIELFKSSLPTIRESIEKVRELVKNSKNWK